MGIPFGPPPSPLLSQGYPPRGVSAARGHGSALRFHAHDNSEHRDRSPGGPYAMSEILIGRRTKKAHSNEWTFFVRSLMGLGNLNR